MAALNYTSKHLYNYFIFRNNFIKITTEPSEHKGVWGQSAADIFYPAFLNSINCTGFSPDLKHKLSSDECKFIPLAECWLRCFEFVKNNDRYMKQQQDFECVVIEQDDKKYYFEFLVRGTPKNSENIKYVHELQNIYHECCGLFLNETLKKNFRNLYLTIPFDDAARWYELEDFYKKKRY